VSGEERLKPHDMKAAKALIKREVKTEVKSEVKSEAVTTSEDVKPSKKSRKRKKAPSTGSDSGLATSPPSQPSPEFDGTDMSAYKEDSTSAVSKK
jgi:hypothetical protein